MHVQKGGIAFFDSGIGGLTVLAECQKYLKSHILYYYGDNARAPYGNLSHSVMWSYVKEAFDLFADLQVKAAVVACNTVTALCIENLRKNYSFPIIGAEPAIMQAARQTEGEVLILATKGTLESERFRLLYQKTERLYPQARLIPHACVALAGAIERNVHDAEYSYIQHLPKRAPDAVVLGCTHYLYIKEQIQAYYRCPCYDGNAGIALRLREIVASKLHFQREKEEAAYENWEGKPLDEISDAFWGEITTDDPFQQKEYNTNKCSWLYNGDVTSKNGQIFFLGSGKMQNKRIYEQTFAF